MRSPRSASRLLVEPEHLGEAEWVGAFDHGFFELPVDEPADFLAAEGVVAAPRTRIARP